MLTLRAKSNLQGCRNGIIQKLFGVHLQLSLLFVYNLKKTECKHKVHRFMWVVILRFQYYYRHMEDKNIKLKSQKEN